MADSRKAGRQRGVHDGGGGGAVARLRRQASRGHVRGRWAGRVARRVGHGTGWRRDGGSTSGRNASERRVHATSGHGVVTIGSYGNAKVGRATVHGRWAVTESAILVTSVDACSGVAGVLINGFRHLTKQVVHLYKVLLGADVGHGEVVLLSERVLGNGSSRATHGLSLGLGHVLLGACHGAATGNGQSAVKRQQRAADISVGAGVNLAALGVAEPVIDKIKSALAVITATTSGSGAITQMLSARGVHGRLAEVETVVGRGLRSIVAACMGTRAEARVTRAHMAIVIVVAGSLGLVGAIVHAALGIVSTRQHGVVGMGLDVLLQVLRALERLAAKIALVRLKRNVNTDVRGNVVALDGSCAASVPLAGQAQVVGALATDMAFADVILIKQF